MSVCTIHIIARRKYIFRLVSPWLIMSQVFICFSCSVYFLSIAINCVLPRWACLLPHSPGPTKSSVIQLPLFPKNRPPKKKRHKKQCRQKTRDIPSETYYQQYVSTCAEQAYLHSLTVPWSSNKQQARSKSEPKPNRALVNSRK